MGVIYIDNGTTTTAVRKLDAVTASSLNSTYATAVLTANVTTVTPTFGHTCIDATVVAGVSGVIKFGTPASLARAEICLSVAFSAGSWVTIQNAAGTTLVQDYAGTARTYNYRFYFNGTAWVDRTPYFARWKRILDVDFTAQANQTFTTDGNYTVAGQTFVVANAANLFPSYTATFGIINGTGLRIPSQNTGITWATDGAALTYPYVGIAPFAGMQNSRRVRIAIKYGASSIATGAAASIALIGQTTAYGPYARNDVNTAGQAVSSSGAHGYFVASTNVTAGTGLGIRNAGTVLGIDSLGPLSPVRHLFPRLMGLSLTDLDSAYFQDALYGAYVTTASNSGLNPSAYFDLANRRVQMAAVMNTPAIGDYITIERLAVETLEIGGA